MYNTGYQRSLVINMITYVDGIAVKTIRENGLLSFTVDGTVYPEITIEQLQQMIESEYIIRLDAFYTSLEEIYDEFDRTLIDPLYPSSRLNLISCPTTTTTSTTTTTTTTRTISTTTTTTTTIVSTTYNVQVYARILNNTDVARIVWSVNNGVNNILALVQVEDCTFMGTISNIAINSILYIGVIDALNDTINVPFNIVNGAACPAYPENGVYYIYYGSKASNSQSYYTHTSQFTAVAISTDRYGLAPTTTTSTTSTTTTTTTTLVGDCWTFQIPYSSLISNGQMLYITYHAPGDTLKDYIVSSIPDVEGMDDWYIINVCSKIAPTFKYGSGGVYQSYSYFGINYVQSVGSCNSFNLPCNTPFVWFNVRAGDTQLQLCSSMFIVAYTAVGDLIEVGTQLYSNIQLTNPLPGSFVGTSGGVNYAMSSGVIGALTGTSC